MEKQHGRLNKIIIAILITVTAMLRSFDTILSLIILLLFYQWKYSFYPLPPSKLLPFYSLSNYCYFIIPLSLIYSIISFSRFDFPIHDSFVKVNRSVLLVYLIYFFFNKCITTTFFVFTFLIGGLMDLFFPLNNMVKANKSATARHFFSLISL